MFELIKMKKLKEFFKRRRKLSIFCASMLYLGFSHLLPDIVNGPRNIICLHKSNVPRYSSLDQAIQDLEREKKKLGLENAIIGITFIDDSYSTYVDRYTTGKYLIVLGKERNIDELQHELWHIYESKQGLLSTSFIYDLINPLHPTLSEWRATTYALNEPNR